MVSGVSTRQLLEAPRDCCRFITGLSPHLELAGCRVLLASYS